MRSTKFFKVYRIDDIFCVEPYYHGVPVGIRFCFCKQSSFQSFLDKYKSYHTLNFWRNVWNHTHSYDFCRNLIDSISPESRFLFIYS